MTAVEEIRRTVRFDECPNPDFMESKISDFSKLIFVAKQRCSSSCQLPSSEEKRRSPKSTRGHSYPRKNIPKCLLTVIIKFKL